MQEPEIARNRLSYLWLLPVIALGIGLWLAYSHLSQIGPVIRIAFTSAEGLDAGKTKIRYNRKSAPAASLVSAPSSPATTSPSARAKKKSAPTSSSALTKRRKSRAPKKACACA